MPDRIEIAATGRARCRICKRAIAKGEERFAEAAPNPVAEGETQHYYHLACAADRRPKTFGALLASFDPPRADLEPLARAAAIATEHHRLERLGQLERAKSARANCRQCRELIEKAAWRVALQPMEDGRLGAWGFVHLRCVAAYAGVIPELERLLRYSELSPEDTAEIGATVATLPVPEPVPKEAAADNASADETPESTDRAGSPPDDAS